MKLSTGKVAFPIEFDNGDNECIYFNPNDPNLSIRFADFMKKIDEKIKSLGDTEIKSDGTIDGDFALVEQFEKFQNELYAELDVAFGGEVSAVVFKHCSPFAVVDGEYFIINFMTAIKPEIEKHIKKANAQVEKKMAKHLEKYKK